MKNNVCKKNIIHIHQLGFPINLEIIIPKDDSVRTLYEVTEGLNYSKLYETYSTEGRNPMILPETLFRIVAYGYMEGIYSSRKLEKACKRDINFRWLLQGQKEPSHNTIARFRSKRLEGCVEDLFSQFIIELEKRNEMRKRLDISDCIAIGHVGGFFEQKNHKFLIKIFREVLNRKPNAKLFLIGDGPLKDEIMKNVSDIRKSVIFVGTVDNVNDYMQAMDIMVLPSLFEGLPLVAIEWQINGLPSLLSNTITEDCNITNMVRFESLEEAPYIWTNDILEMLEKENRLENSQKAISLVRKNGFDIYDNAKILEKIYKS